MCATPNNKTRLFATWCFFISLLMGVCAARVLDPYPSITDVDRTTTSGELLTHLWLWMVGTIGMAFFGRNRGNDVVGPQDMEDQLRQALATAEQGDRLLRTLMENLPEGIMITDASGRLQMVSRRGQELLGTVHQDDTIEEMIAEWEFYEPDGETRMPIEELPLMRAIRRGETVQDAELARKNARGDKVYLLCNAAPIRDEFGKIVAAVVAWHDISQRKLAERRWHETQQQNDFLAGLVRESSQPLGVGYPDGSLGLVNRAFEELTGYTTEELKLLDWAAALTPPEWRAMEQDKLATLRQTGRPVRYEKEYLRKDGTRIPVELLVHLVTDANGAPHYYYSFLTDISDRKHAEAALQTNQKRFELLATVAERLLRADNPQAIVDELCQMVMEHLDCHVFFNYLVEESGKPLVLNAYAGISEEEAAKIARLEFGVSVCGCVAQECQRIIAQDIQHGRDSRNELVKSYGVQAYCCHPMTSLGQPIGTLSFGTRTRPRFSVDEIGLMKSVADQVAVAIQSLRGNQRLQAGMRELRAANEELACFNRLMVDRELRMIELKKEVNALRKQCGQQPRYAMDSQGDAPLPKGHDDPIT